MQVGTAVSFHDRSTGDPVAWWWDFGDGRTSDQSDPTTAYDTAGVYDVSLYCQNAQGWGQRVHHRVAVTWWD